LFWFGCLSDRSSWSGLARIVNAVCVNECVLLLHPADFIFVDVLFEAFYLANGFVLIIQISG
jgi:hypothetical protein